VTERTRAEVFDVVTDAVVEILPAVDRAAVRPELHLKDLGADSVDRVEIIVTVLEELGIGEPLSSFADLPDIEAMVELLHGRSAELASAAGRDGVRR
jgi:polyketide biosynthesis acyl carrier protein